MSQLAETNERLKGTIARMREQGEIATRRVVMGVTATAGGALAGYLQAKMPVLPGTGDKDAAGNVVPNTGVPMDLVLGLAVAAAGLLELGGKYNEELMAFGFGMSAATAAAAVRERSTGGADVFPRGRYIDPSA